MEAREIIKKDIETLYLGNLNTVEFDLNLPKKGKYGSDISWKSGHERFLDGEGKVNRPPYGTGDRTISLWAEFSYGEEKECKEYKVCILEEKPEIEVEKIEKPEMEVQSGTTVYLPHVTVIYTKDGKTLVHKINWENGAERRYDSKGIYEETGQLDGLDWKVCCKVTVKEKIQCEKKDTKPWMGFFDHGESVLEEGSRFYTAQKEMQEYLLATDDDQMLYNFREACGLDLHGAEPMTGWDAPECNLKGHTTGHYLSGLALCYKAGKDERIKEKACYMIQELAKCQDTFSKMPNIREGFLSGYTEEQFDQLEEFTPYPEIWAPYYTLHKIFAGLLDCYEFAGITQALDIAERLGEWVYRRLSVLSREKRMKMWGMYIAGEYGGMNDVMARLYRITGKEEFLETARYFDNEKLFLPMEKQIDALGGLHANQHIPQIIGAMEAFRATGEKRYYDIASFFWKAVVSSHLYSIGGTGENEMFHGPDCIGNLLTKHTAESCASYNMMKLTKELYRYESKKDMMDYYERAMTNHILGGREHGSTGETVYFMPLAPGFHKEFLHENSCCHGTGLESHFKYADMIYAHHGRDLYVNLFLKSRLNWEEEEIIIRQTTEMENPEKVVLQVECENPFFMYVRIPKWSKAEREVRLDSERTEKYEEKEGYICIEVPEGTHKVQCIFPCGFYLESTPDRPELKTLLYGPYVLAAMNEKEEFMELNLDGEIADRTAQKEGLTFTIQNFIWKPLFDINQEKFQVYWKRVNRNRI